MLDFAYHVKFKPGNLKEAFVREVKNITGAKAVNLMMQEAIVEI